jgi:hypothetical protein
MTLVGEMARVFYYLSDSPATPSPPTEELFSIVADSAAAAITKIRRAFQPQGPAVWAHVIVWSSADGEQQGFESTRLR